jgi:hypothetical protein
MAECKLINNNYLAFLECINNSKDIDADLKNEAKEFLDNREYELVKVRGDLTPVLDEKGNRILYKNSTPLTLEEWAEDPKVIRAGGVDKYSRKFLKRRGYAIRPVASTQDETVVDEIALEEVFADQPRQSADLFGNRLLLHDVDFQVTQDIFNIAYENELSPDKAKPKIKLIPGIYNPNIDEESLNALLKLPERDQIEFENSLFLPEDQQKLLDQWTNETAQDYVLQDMSNDLIKKDLEKCNDTLFDCTKKIYNNIAEESYKFLTKEESEIARLNENIKIAIDNPDKYDKDFVNDLKEKLAEKRKNLGFDDDNVSSQIYDPETGKLISVKKIDGVDDYGDASNAAIQIEEDAIELVTNNLIENSGEVGVLQDQQMKLYYQLVGLSKLVVDEWKNIEGSDRPFVEETITAFKDFFTSDKAFKQIKKIAETGELPKDLKLDYFTRGDSTLATKFNETINKFLVTSRAISLNKDPLYDEENPIREGLNRKFRESTGVNVLNYEKDTDNVLKYWQDSFEPLGLDFMDQIKKDERLKVSLVNLTYNTTLDLVPLLAGIAVTKKVPGYNNIMKGFGSIGRFLTNEKAVGGIANSKTWKTVVSSVIGVDGKGASGVKEMLTLGAADKILEFGFGHKPMPGEFGFILGTTNSIVEQKYMAAALVRLSQKIPGIKYIYGSESGRKVINSLLVSAPLGTGAMTFTEAAQYALGTSEYEEFKEVFMSSDPNQPASGKLLSLYLSFAAIGLGNSGTAKAIYRDVKAAANRVSRKELDGAELLGIKSNYKAGKTELVKSPDGSTATEQSGSLQRKKEIQSAYDKKVESVKNDTKLSEKEKGDKLAELELAKENLLEALEYKDVMFTLEKQDRSQKHVEKDVNKIISKSTTIDGFNISSLNAKEIVSIANMDPILVARSLVNTYGTMTPKAAKQIAQRMREQALLMNNTANAIVGEGPGKLRDQVIETLKEASYIQNAIKELQKPSTKQEYGITGELQVEQLRVKLNELKEKLQEQANEAGDIAVDKAFKDAAAFGKANVKVNLLTSEQYKARGLDPKSEGAFEQKQGEIFINLDVLRNDTRSQNVVAHEVGHQIVLGTLKDVNGKLTPSGEKILLEFQELLTPEQKNTVNEALSKNYKNKPREQQLEEFFTIFMEKVADGQIKAPAGKEIKEIATAEDLLNLAFRVPSDLKLILEGKTDSLSQNLIDAIEKASTKANTEGAQYKRFEPKEDIDLGFQLNELITTKNKMEFMETDWLNIDTNIRQGNFDRLFPKGINAEQKARLRVKLAERLVGQTERGGYDPVKGKFGTWIYDAIRQGLKDVNKDLYKESENQLVELSDNTTKIIDTTIDSGSVGEAPTITLSKIKRGLKLTPNEIDQVKFSITTPILNKIREIGAEKLTRKDIQKLRKDFLTAEGPSGKLRKLILKKVNELGKDGLQTKDGVNLVYDISLSRMTNSLKGGGKGFSIFLEPVLKPNGEQARYTVEEANALGIPLEKSGSGPLKYKKRPLSDFIGKDGKPTQEYLNWIKGTDIASGARGRKDSIVNELTGEIGIEAMLSTMIDQKIVRRNDKGEIETVDLFPDATAGEKTKMASDAIINFVGDKIARVYKDTSNLLYSKKEIKKFTDAMLSIKPKDGIFSIEQFALEFNKQSSDIKKLFNEQFDGDFVSFIKGINLQNLEEKMLFFDSELKKSNPEYYNEISTAYKEQFNFKRYLKEVGIKYTSEKDLVKPEFNADGTKNPQNIERTKGILKDFIKQFGPWDKLTKDQQTYILGSIGYGKSLRKALGLTLQGRTREQMLVDIFGKDVLKGEGDIVIPDIKMFDPTSANKKKIEELINNKDKYTLKELREKVIELMIPKGKDISYFETMVAQNQQALGSTLKSFLKSYDKSKNKTETLENIVNFLKLQTNFNKGLKGLFPITDILLEAKGSVNKKGEITDKKLHFEHNLELFNFSKRFIEILKSDKSLEAKEILIEKLVEESSQSIISEDLRALKDSDGRTVFGSLDPRSATYKYREGAAANALDLMNPAGGTVEQAINSKILKTTVDNIIKRDTKGIDLSNLIKEGGTIRIKSDGKLEPIYSKKKFNEKLNLDFNEILSRTINIPVDKKITGPEARVLGRGKSPIMKFFYGAEDFGGLTYSILSGKGERGNKDVTFFKDNLVQPYNRGVTKTEVYGQTLKKDFTVLLKQSNLNKVLGDLPGKGNGLEKKVEGTNFTYDQAVRVYLWDKAKYKIPGLEKVDQTRLVNLVKTNPELQAFADSLLKISKEGKFTEPGEYWDIRNLSYDMLVNQTNRARKMYLGEFTNNVDVIFSKENLNKLEATYGPEYRSALESSIRRMKSGSNRPGGGTATENAFLNWTNNSVGAIMFFNRKSALLQTLSSVNFINWGDNNPVQAAKAFANQPQFWSDFKMIFNSDKLKARREGLGLDVNHNEIAKAIKGSTNKASAALSYLLKFGFTPTQLADSFAIASGGATMYRNRVNTYLKEGLSAKEAEAKAWEDFSAISEQTQQSADPSLISQQQSSTLGRLVLAFQNTPMQYTRIITKSVRNLASGRGDFKTDVSKIAYYGVVQNMMFASLQNALFSELQGFDGEDGSEPITEKQQNKKNKKINRIVNNMMDTMGRGFGVYGAAGTQLKNVVLKYMEQEKMDAFQKDHAKTLIEIINYSPPLGSKLRKVYNAIQGKEFDKDIIAERGFDVTYEGKVNISPAYNVMGSLVEGVTNVPMERTLVELNSLIEMFDTKNSAFQRLALLLGWRSWDVGASNEEMDDLSVKLKERRKQEKKDAKEKEKLEKKRLKEEKRFEGLSNKEINNLKRRDQIEVLTKQQQIDSLIKLGVSKKDIRSLRLESDRIDKIIEINNK